MQDSKPIPLAAGAEEKWIEVVSDLENLTQRTKPGQMETSREHLRGIIGEVQIQEEGDGIFAFVSVNPIEGYKYGAQERT